MLNLSVKSQIMKIGKHKGKTMYYAQVDKPRVIEYEDVIKDIAEMSSLTTGDVRNAIDRLAYYLQRELTEGNTVKLGQIGTFRVAVPSVRGDGERGQCLHPQKAQNTVLHQSHALGRSREHPLRRLSQRSESR